MLKRTTLFAATFALAGLFPGEVAGQEAAVAADASSARPKAVICVAVDQLRADYLERCRPWFVEGGFKRLEREGAVSPECRFEYSVTVTSAGHATLMTGANPRVHGIVENGFYSRTEGQMVYSVEEKFGYLVDDQGNCHTTGATPKRLLVPTIMDELEAATGGASITLSIAAKDRSAVLMGGMRPDEAYWFNLQCGGYVTSDYYARRIAPWLSEFQKPGPLTKYLGATWDLVRPKDVYEKLCMRDDQKGESAWSLPNTMPKVLPAEWSTSFLNQFAVTPMADRYTVEVAKAGMTALGVGKDDVPDLVAISLSAFDKAGHAYGPDSYEMIDFTFRLDETLADLMTYLDDQIGEGQYVLILSADHGVAPLPEVIHERGEDHGGRLDYDTIFDGMREHLKALYPDTPCASYFLQLPYVYLQPSCEDANRRQFASTIIDYLRNQPGIADVFTREQLEAGDGEPGTALYAAQQSYHPDRSGDLFIQVAPYFIFMKETGTTHYTPYTYDALVPLIAYGMGYGVNGGKDNILREGTSPRWMAILARRALGLPQPEYVDTGKSRGDEG